MLPPIKGRLTILSISISCGFGIRFGGVREQLPQLSQMDLFIDVAGGAKRGVTRYALPTRRVETFRFYYGFTSYNLSCICTVTPDMSVLSTLAIGIRPTRRCTGRLVQGRKVHGRWSSRLQTNSVDRRRVQTLTHSTQTQYRCRAVKAGTVQAPRAAGERRPLTPRTP